MFGLDIEGIESKPKRRIVSHCCSELSDSLRPQAFEYCLKGGVADPAVAYQFLSVAPDVGFFCSQTLRRPTIA
jgi:hypothetical protein